MGQPSVVKSYFAPHESLELHELLSSSIVCYKKTKSSLAMVSDPELKAFMEDSLQGKETKMREIEEFIRKEQKTH